MKLWQYSLVVVCMLLFYGCVCKLCKKKKPLRRAFLSMLCGNIVLLLVDIASLYTGVYLPVSALSLTVSACAGVPGVAVMLIISCLM
ncbi:MAG: pro-sigmaK processing inhibitor BofA family protein [Ruminococcus sp.]|nr:pro-sigmaK processing inhibitor BofA family protein [Ruminococcus sp.]